MPRLRSALQQVRLHGLEGLAVLLRSNVYASACCVRLERLLEADAEGEPPRPPPELRIECGPAAWRLLASLPPRGSWTADYFANRTHGLRWCYVGLWNGEIAHVLWLAGRGDPATVSDWQPLEDEVEIRNVHTLPGCRRRGIFAHVARSALRDARERRVRIAVAHVDESNAASRAGFAALGFRATERIRIRRILGFDRVVREPMAATGTAAPVAPMTQPPGGADCTAITTCTDIDPVRWDAFLRSLPDNHHRQSSLWAELKAPGGWRALRIALLRDGAIVGGLQLLYRPVAKLGAVAYAPRGPVFAIDDLALPEALMRELDPLVRTLRLRYLAIQAPASGAGVVRALHARGFRPTPLQLAPTATVLIDVQRTPDALLASLRPSTRRAVRIALRSGLRVRVGGESDLGVFHALHAATGRRHEFEPLPPAYFAQLWRLFAPEGHLVLFIAEFDGQAVAAELDLAFGDTLVSKRAGWSGTHAKLHPNELLVWTAMAWARERGLKYYDMEGLHPDLADALLRGEPVSAAFRQSHHAFKLGFGGQIIRTPENHELVPVPVLGWGHRVIWHRGVPRAWQQAALRRLRLL